MTTIKAMRELAKASKQINNHPDMRIQVAERKDGKEYNSEYVDSISELVWNCKQVLKEMEENK